MANKTGNAALKATVIKKCPPDVGCLNAPRGDRVMPIGPGAINGINVISLQSERLTTARGELVSMRLVLFNDTGENIKRYRTIVSLPSVLQGQPDHRPPTFVIEFGPLGAGETAEFYFNDKLSIG
jgi:hypothetical protein